MRFYCIDNFLNEVLNFDSLFGFIIGEEEAVASNYKLSYINQHVPRVPTMSNRTGNPFLPYSHSPYLLSLTVSFDRFFNVRFAGF